MLKFFRFLYFILNDEEGEAQDPGEAATQNEHKHREMKLFLLKPAHTPVAVKVESVHKEDGEEAEEQVELVKFSLILLRIRYCLHFDIIIIKA